jgi:hypothetical protein
MVIVHWDREKILPKDITPIKVIPKFSSSLTKNYS